MPVEERRRIALHHAVAGAWGEEVADTLFELVTPAGREPATGHDLVALGRDVDARFDEVVRRFEQVDRRFEQVDRRFEQIDLRFEQIDRRFEQIDLRFDQLEERLDDRLANLGDRLTATFERRISDAVTTQTRTLVWSQLAALVTISALAFGLLR